MDTQSQVVSPYLRRGVNTQKAMLLVLVFLTANAVHFGFRYETSFLWRFPMHLGIAGLIESVYHLLHVGRFRKPHLSTLVTAALLVSSVPSFMPWHEVATGTVIAVLFGKLMVDRKALRFNPMLLGRLAMMLLFANSIQTWLPPGMEIDAWTSATPLGLYGMEGVALPLRDLLFGQIMGDWEGIYAILPGSPGCVFPLLSLIAGAILYWFGVEDWRPGIAFIVGMAAGCAVLGMPIGFNLLAGSTLFTAVFIVGDWRSMPGSRGGRLVAGLLAGLLNAYIRDYGYYPEGVVVAVLIVNAFSPTLDRIAFVLRGWRLRMRVHFAR